jgi:hypothetical protein
LGEICRPKKVDKFPAFFHLKSSKFQRLIRD